MGALGHRRGVRAQGAARAQAGTERAAAGAGERRRTRGAHASRRGGRGRRVHGARAKGGHATQALGVRPGRAAGPVGYALSALNLF